MLTIAQIAAHAAASTLSSLSDGEVTNARHAVAFALDPKHLGPDAHLRCEVDPCGLSPDELRILESAVWDEDARRQDARR